jgi:hypothetical protein
MLRSDWMIFEILLICCWIVSRRPPGLVALHRLLEQLRVTLDHPHRRADLVREAGDERPDRGQLFGGLSPPLGLCELFFGRLAFRQVSQDSGEEPPVRELHLAHGEVAREDCAVVAAAGDLLAEADDLSLPGV